MKKSSRNKASKEGWGRPAIERIHEIFDAYGIPRGSEAETHGLSDCIQLLALGATVCPIIRKTKDGGFLEVVVVDQSISEIVEKP